MDVTGTAIPEIKLITPRRFADGRGFFSETYNRLRFAEHGVDLNFVQDNLSLSTEAGTVRGLHFQSPPCAQAKLVWVVSGAVLDVVVDIRKGSPNFGRHVAATLSAENGRQIFVPEGFAHGFCTLEADTLVAYKASAYYAPDHEHGLLWSDPALAIDWPVESESATLSVKDHELPLLDGLADHFLYRDSG